MPDPAKPPLQLLIPDAALHDAVVEQLVLAGFHAASVKDADAVAAGAVLIADEAAFDKKLQKTLTALDPAPTVLLLGEAGEGAASESFAKPLRLGHLLARARFYLETAPRLRATPLSFGPYRLEPQNRRLIVTGGDAVIRLTEKETALLEYLGARREPVAREELLAAIWGYDRRIDTHTLETHIYQLRRKLDADGKGAGLLLNEDGAYRLVFSGGA
jgi:hypothetical protein